jgi:hypothetical protein
MIVVSLCQLFLACVIDRMLVLADREGNGTSLTEGDVITFKVRNVQHANGIININGSL